MIKGFFKKKDASSRIPLIDALRGVAVLLMVAHHFLYDLWTFLGAPSWLFTNPVFDFLHYVFAGLFIMLSGVSARFSRSNLKRGLKVIAAALAITLVTWQMDMIIVFGILHFLGFSMVFYALTRRLWDRIPEKAAPILYVALTVASILFLDGVSSTSNWLWMFGITYAGFFSADYFPILPWIFVFLFGTWMGEIIRQRRMPEWFYSVRVPRLSSVGRKSFLIYLVHQPILYGLTMLIGFVLGLPK